MNRRQPALQIPRNRILLIAGIGLALVTLAIALFWRSGIFSTPDRTWQAIQERGAWRVGMDPSFPPFETLDEAGRPVGYDVDLAKAIAAELGVEVEIVAIGFDGLIDALQVGRIDSVISALPYDSRLTQDVRYTSSYFEAGTRLVVPTGSPIITLDDLSGHSIAVEWGSAGDAEVRGLQRTDPTIERLPFSTPDEALAALLAGESDALALDGVTLRLAQGRGAGVTAVGPPLESDPYVIAVPFQARMLHEAIEKSLTNFREDGTLASLEEHWFAPAD